MPLKLKHSTIAFSDELWNGECHLKYKYVLCYNISKSDQHKPLKYTMNDVTVSTVIEVKDLCIYDSYTVDIPQQTLNQ